MWRERAQERTSPTVAFDGAKRRLNAPGLRPPPRAAAALSAAAWRGLRLSVTGTCERWSVPARVAPLSRRAPRPDGAADAPGAMIRPAAATATTVPSALVRTSRPPVGRVPRRAHRHRSAY